MSSSESEAEVRTVRTVRRISRISLDSEDSEEEIQREKTRPQQEEKKGEDVLTVTRNVTSVRNDSQTGNKDEEHEESKERNRRSQDFQEASKAQGEDAGEPADKEDWEDLNGSGEKDRTEKDEKREEVENERARIKGKKGDWESEEKMEKMFKNEKEEQRREERRAKEENKDEKEKDPKENERKEVRHTEGEVLLAVPRTEEKPARSLPQGSSAKRSGWRFKEKGSADEKSEERRDKTKVTRQDKSPLRPKPWTSQARRQSEGEAEISVFERLHSSAKRKVALSPAKEMRAKDSEVKVFMRLYEDALMKREEMAKRREAKEQKEITDMERQLQTKQAPEDEVMAMCERLYEKHRTVKPHLPQEKQEEQAKAKIPDEELNKKQDYFIKQQSLWNAKRIQRVEEERARKQDSERKYMEEHSIHRSLTPVRDCFDRLFKDSGQRAVRLDKLRIAAKKDEDLIVMQAGALHRSCADAGVFARLHQDFEERSRKLEQKRMDQVMQWQQACSPRSSRTPSTATHLSQTSGSESARQTPRTPRGNKSREKDVTSVTPRVAQGNSSLSPKKFGDRRRVRSCERQKAKECVTSTDPTPTASRREVEGEDVVKQTEPMFIDAGVRRSAKSLHAKVAFSVISARGSLAEDAWCCSVEVAGSARTILQTDTVDGTFPVWNAQAEAVLLQADTLQF